MNVMHRDKDLERLEQDAQFDGGYPREIIQAYRKRMQSIRAAMDERDLRAMKSNRFKKLKGKRSHEHSIRLNDQWRLIVEIEQASPGNIINIKSIEDYH